MLPVFGLVLCGWIAGRTKLVGAESSDALNQFVYYFALPAMLFAAVARGSLAQIFNLPFLAGVVVATLACAAAGFALSAWISGGTPQEHSLRALNASFSNTGYLGIPLVTVAYGPEAALFALGVFVSRQSMREGMAAAWPGVALKLALHPLIAAVIFYGLLNIDPLWAKVAVVGASLPLGATAFVLAQR